MYISVSQRQQQQKPQQSGGYIPVAQRTNQSQPTQPSPTYSGGIRNIAEAIAKIESSGRYNAMGPRTNRGDYAYGKYQVMGANIPSWTKQALGYSMTPQQFLNNPKAQDAVAYNQMGRIYKQYKDPRQVASIWFSGQPMKGNVAKDITGTSVPTYIKNFQKALGSYQPTQMSSASQFSRGGYIPVAMRKQYGNT